MSQEKMRKYTSQNCRILNKEKEGQRKKKENKKKVKINII